MENFDNEALLGVVPDNYWAKRCELAETCNEESPCDPDILEDQIKAWNAYHKFIKEQGQRDYP